MVKDALSAENTIIIGKDNAIQVPDHGTRLKAADMALKVMDAYPSAGGGTGGERPNPQQHLHVHAQMSEAELRFLLLHSRYPTEAEKQALKEGKL